MIAGDVVVIDGVVHGFDLCQEAPGPLPCFRHEFGCPSPGIWVRAIMFPVESQQADRIKTC
jgi:hypothetical protein